MVVAHEKTAICIIFVWFVSLEDAHAHILLFKPEVLNLFEKEAFHHIIYCRSFSFIF